MLRRSMVSIVAQTYTDWELIVVDDGPQERADIVVASFGDERIQYIAHEQERGGAAARNTGIRAATGKFIAFQDDDDEWLPRKLEVQMGRFESTPPDVGFCFSAVKNIYSDKEEATKTHDGIGNYFESAIDFYPRFLTVTLVLKKEVFDRVGLFDEAFPSHQEAELMIRVAKLYKGLGINKPLTLVNMKEGRGSVGGDLYKRIKGREMIIKKHLNEFNKRPQVLAGHYFRLGLFYRDNNQFGVARKTFWKALRLRPRVLYLLHYVSMGYGGILYRLTRKNTV